MSVDCVCYRVSWLRLGSGLLIVSVRFCVSVDCVCYRVSIAAGFAGWMSYLVSILLQHHTDMVQRSPQLNNDTNQRHCSTLSLAFLAVAAAVAIFLLGTTSPRDVLYCMLTVLDWCQTGNLIARFCRATLSHVKVAVPLCNCACRALQLCHINKNWPISVRRIPATKLHRIERCSTRRRSCATVEKLRDTACHTCDFVAWYSCATKSLDQIAGVTSVLWFTAPRGLLLSRDNRRWWMIVNWSFFALSFG